jgi:D-alanyl-D-alanine carboxypeptidase/D-alanyl-D-alanine-endopeptidase (penicillin-binding protein 4)
MYERHWLMLTLVRLYGLFLLLAFALPAHAELPAAVSRALKAEGVPADAVSVFVQQVDARKPLVAHRADQAMNPASTMKLLTTYAGLELLGPSYTWRTEFYASAPLRDDVLAGDLILKGYGDPALTLENFWNLVRALRQKGLREIRGDLVLDRGYFADAGYDPGAFDGEPWRAYNAGPDALLVNFKATRFRFSGDAQGGKVMIAVDPELPQLGIVNNLTLSHVPCADWKSRLGYRVQRAAGLVTVTFSGNYSLACGEKSLDLSVLDDATYVFQLFRRLWMEQGGVFNGGLRSGSVPQNAILMVQAVSPPLTDVIRLVNKYSNNVMARQLLLSVGAERFGPPGSADKGRQAVQEWLASKGKDFPELVIENGAGLSREERVSARHLGELLLAAYASPAMPELMSSLPIVAVDGTMERRLKNSAVVGRAHLKSGSLDGVRAIAGYLLDSGGRRWVVVFMANHALAGNTKAAQDALLEWLHQRE